RNQERHEEQEDHVTHHSRHHPQEQQHHREPGQLDPARDHDLRRPGGHANDRTAGVRQVRGRRSDRSNVSTGQFRRSGGRASDPGIGTASGASAGANWDWEWVEGSLARDPAALRREAPRVRKGGTVPRMPAPHRQVSAARRHRRRRKRPVHRTRRLVVLTVVTGALLGTLLVTAFGQGATRHTSQALPGRASRLLTVGPPTPLTVAIRGGLRIQLPIAQSSVTAIGYHSSGDGALPLTPLGRQGNEGALSRLAHKIFGGGGGGFVYYQL